MSEQQMAATDLSIQINGFKFHCRLEGVVDGPWLIFSNSLATGMSVWDEQVQAFADRYRILRYDQRGHGQTEVPSTACTFDQLTEDAAALLDHFEIESAVFVGVSMGAVTAIRLAQLYSGRLRAIIACDGQPCSPASAAETWETRIAAVRASGMSVMVEPTVGRWFQPDFQHRNPTRLEQVRTMIRTTPAEGYIACAKALLDYDHREGLAEIKLPVLLLVGAEDGVLPVAMQSMHESIPNSSFIKIPRAGHLPNIERPAEVTQAIQQFLDSLK